MANRDPLQHFLFEHLPIRGEFARLDVAWRTEIQARGPLRLLVVQVGSNHTLRGLARWDGEPAPAVPCAPGEAELQRALAEHDTLRVDCEFCGHRHAFDPIDIAGPFAAATPDASATRH
jgi:redox-regulated HSP33 family molecular chaperone